MDGKLSQIWSQAVFKYYLSLTLWVAFSYQILCFMGVQSLVTNIIKFLDLDISLSRNVLQIHVVTLM